MTRLLLACIAVFAASAAQAQDPLICTDRPAKANAVCTVPPGHVQLETSVAAWSLTRSGGARTELLTVGGSVAKLGLTDRSDLQIGFTPFAQLTVESGSPRRISGIGDVIVRYKRRLGDGDGPVQIALVPFVKLPTASAGLGNGRVEGGIAVPFSFAVPGGAALTLGPELDLLADADGRGRHAAFVNLVNLAAPIAARLTVAGELWTSFGFDPDGTVEQASLDTALAYAVSSDMQLDIGANIGLTRATPDIETYVGLSVRF